MNTRLILVVMMMLVCATVAQPQDADEAEAWGLYNEYRQCKASEASMEDYIKQKFSDALMGAAGTYSIFGLDGEARAQATLRLRDLEKVRQREEQLLAAWQSKFYWRYGDLRWSSENIKDPKTGQVMDRIQFAMTYFRFHRQAQTAAAGQASTASTASFVAEKGGPDLWSHLRVGLSNVASFKTQDQPGWRNNGTSFSAVAGSGVVGLELSVTGKPDVSYDDYQLRATVTTSSGRPLLQESSTVSKAGGSKRMTVQWQPSQDPGPLEVRISLSGGNPEGFTYFVSGRIEPPPAGQSANPTGTAIPATSSSAGTTSSASSSQPGPGVELYRNGNDMAVFNGGQPVTLSLSSAATLTEVTHYHWNDGKGAPAGTILFKSSDGTVYGPWQATLVNGVYWVVTGPINLPAGSYTLHDSDPATWSQNSGSGGQGIVILKGRPQAR